MRVEDFGFTPVVGQDYNIAFTQDGELLVDVIYDGSPLPAIEFKDNSKITFTVTNRSSGNVEKSIDFIHYNGGLYKTQFDLKFKNDNTNSGANVYISELAYDLTTGSVNVELQAFVDENYTLIISDTTTGNIATELPVTHQDGMVHSIPVEMIQGNEIKVALVDQFGEELDYKNFTAPISTDWRSTSSVTDNYQNGELPTDDLTLENGENIDNGNLSELVEVSEDSGFISKVTTGIKDNIIPVGICLLLMVVLIIILIVRKSKRGKKTTTEEFVEEEIFNFEDEDEASKD